MVFFGLVFLWFVHICNRLLASLAVLFHNLCFSSASSPVSRMEHSSHSSCNCFRCHQISSLNIHWAVRLNGYKQNSKTTHKKRSIRMQRPYIMKEKEMSHHHHHHRHHSWSLPPQSLHIKRKTVIKFASYVFTTWSSAILIKKEKLVVIAI